MPNKNALVDLFCGAGGFSLGALRAAQRLEMATNLTAINHNVNSIATHSHNLAFPNVHHICETLDSINARNVVPGRRCRLLLASPECTHHSNAAGGRPRNEQSRASANHVLRFAEALYVEDILMENVREFMDWGPLNSKGKPIQRLKGKLFKAFLQTLDAMDYKVDFRLVNAANYGDATTRTRFILQARRRKKVHWPDASHHNPKADDFSASSLKPWRPAREIIDWTIPGTSIFKRKELGMRPLCDNTMARIRAGFHRFCFEPFVMSIRGTTPAHLNSCCRSTDDPMPTITSASRTNMALVHPFVVKCSHGSSGKRGNSGRVRDVDSPLYTIVGKNNLALIQPYFIQTDQTGGNGIYARSVESPLYTVISKQNMGLVQPFMIGQQSGATPRSVDDPVPTIATKGAISLTQPFIVKYYGAARNGVSVDEPLDTITTRDRFALIQPRLGRTIAEFDILYRLFEVQELAAAMSMNNHTFMGSKEEQVKQIGNAIPVEMAEAHAHALLST